MLLTRMIQGCMTGTRTILRMPRASEVTLKNKGKIYITNHNKALHNVGCWDALLLKQLSIFVN